MEAAIANIDGDTLVYRCAFAAEKGEWFILTEDGPVSFQYKKELKAWVKAHGLEEGEYEVEYKKHIEPEEFALQNCKTAMMNIMKVTQATDYNLYISNNKPTFRDMVATIKGYKENRKSDPKPTHYKAVRQYLVDVWGAKITQEGLETDDILGLSQAEDTILVSNDKDLDQIPGKHFDWTKPDDGVYEIHPQDANMFKFIQVIAGDATDNIEGIPGVGFQKAAGFLKGFTGEDIEKAAMNIYESHFTSDAVIPRKKITYKEYAEQLGMTWQEIYEENAQLITILHDAEIIEDD